MEQIWQSIYIFLSTLYVFFFPGLFLSFLFFDPLNKRKQIGIVERIAFSVALSIAVIPLMIFYTHQLGMKITQFTVMLQIFFLLLISGTIILIRILKSHE